MKSIVISQPMFFPWAGIFEQIRLADVFIHYDDVQMPHGRSLISRVQIKSQQGVQWLTAPILRQEKQLIQDVAFDNSRDWRSKHLKTLHASYAKAPYGREMLDLASSIYALKCDHLAEFNIYATEAIAKYLDLRAEFTVSSKFGTTSHSTQKLLELVKSVGGDEYITGHGARHYLDHSMFENNCIGVRYMDYKRMPYRQLDGPFDPHVSILDMIANVGRGAAILLTSASIPWTDFVARF